MHMGGYANIEGLVSSLSTDANKYRMKLVTALLCLNCPSILPYFSRAVFYIYEHDCLISINVFSIRIVMFINVNDLSEVLCCYLFIYGLTLCLFLC